jgi:hypothetical protein
MPDAPAILTDASATPPNNSPFHQPINPEAQRLAAQPPKEVTRIAKPAKPVTPGSKAWAEMSPTERAQQQRTGTEAVRTSESVHTRTPDGRVLIDGKLPDGSTYQPDDKNAPVESAAPATDGEKFKVGEFEVSEAEVRDMLADKAARDLARTQIPAEPKLYKLDLPEGAKLPGDAKVTFGNDSESLAMIEAAQQWAHKKGLSQGEFSELLSIHTHSIAAQELKIQTCARAEIDKLGANGPQRIDAMTQWIVSVMGTNDARPIVASMATAAHVNFYEKLFGKIVNGGSGSFRQTGREVESKGVDDATYNAMSYSEKKAYAERVSSAGNRR